MTNTNPTISIIIVHYKVKEELKSCLDSIYKHTKQISFEVIVVDNEKRSSLKQLLDHNYRQVKYIKSGENIGYGSGNNLGAKHASGKYLFFLNPDTKLLNNVLPQLYDEFNNKKKLGIVAPMLFHADGSHFQQGTQELTPLRALVAHSFINKLFPHNFISKKFWLQDWDKSSNKQVEVVPGTAFMIEKGLFEKVGGFDERFFLYFEENDLCKRVRGLGYSLLILKNAKLYHAWEKSTKQIPDEKRLKIFRDSRSYYFKKHFGLLSAFFIGVFLRINKHHILLVLILLLSAILRLYQIDQLMMFIGDQGWFYLSARDMLLTGNIPLVGITSSHTWLHQGPLWTYLLACVLWVFQFNPVSGAIFTSILGIFTVYLMYLFGSDIYGRKTAIIAALLFASSPLVIIHSRMAYHTSPIPLLTLLLFYITYKWVRGNIKIFPWLFFFLAVLYNFELATVILAAPILSLLTYGYLTKKKYVLQLVNINILLKTFILGCIPMLPVILYDLNNGFVQTVVFPLWIMHNLFVQLGLPSFKTLTHSHSYSEILVFLFTLNQRLVFGYSGIAAFLITVSGIVSILRFLVGEKDHLRYLLLLLFLLIGVAGFIAARTPSEAYLPMLFPLVILTIAHLFSSMISTRTPYVVVFIMLLVTVSNISVLLAQNYYMRGNGYGFTLAERVRASKEIISLSKGREYQLVAQGLGSEQISSKMNYQYLTWWLGHGPISQRGVKIGIEEDSLGIHVRRLDINSRSH